MAVTKIVRIPDQRERSQATKDSLTETLVYHVYTDSTSDTAATARTASVTVGGITTSIPQQNTTLTINGVSCLVQSVEAERLAETPLVFLVTVNAGIQPNSGGGEKWEVTITVDGDEYTEPVFQDKDGNPITNSCKQSFDPPIEKTYYERESISVNFKTNAVDTTTIDACRGKLNASIVTLSITALGYSRTFAAKTLQLKKASYTVTIANDGQPLYWNVSYVFSYNPNTWTRNIVDRGLYELDGTSGKVVPIYDREGQPVTVPQYLDGSGHKLAAGTAAYIYHYDIEQTAAFSGLFTGL